MNYYSIYNFHQKLVQFKNIENSYKLNVCKYDVITNLETLIADAAYNMKKLRNKWCSVRPFAIPIDKFKELLPIRDINKLIEKISMFLR